MSLPSLHCLLVSGCIAHAFILLVVFGKPGWNGIRVGRDTSSEHLSGVEAPLGHFPRCPEVDLRPDLSAEHLRRIAKYYEGKGARDGSGFQDAFSEVWRLAVACGVFPRRWKEGTVALIPKPSEGYRPLTILSLGWGVGAKACGLSLRSWSEQWAMHSTPAGFTKRSVKDRFLAATREEHCYVQQDLTTSSLIRFDFRICCGAWSVWYGWRRTFAPTTPDSLPWLA